MYGRPQGWIQPYGCLSGRPISEVAGWNVHGRVEVRFGNRTRRASGRFCVVLDAVRKV